MIGSLGLNSPLSRCASVKNVRSVAFGNQDEAHNPTIHKMQETCKSVETNWVKPGGALAMLGGVFFLAKGAGKKVYEKLLKGSLEGPIKSLAGFIDRKMAKVKKEPEHWFKKGLYKLGKAIQGKDEAVETVAKKKAKAAAKEVPASKSVESTEKAAETAETTVQEAVEKEVKEAAAEKPKKEASGTKTADNLTSAAKSVVGGLVGGATTVEVGATRLNNGENLLEGIKAFAVNNDAANDNSTEEAV